MDTSSQPQSVTPPNPPTDDVEMEAPPAIPPQQPFAVAAAVAAAPPGPPPPQPTQPKMETQPPLLEQPPQTPDIQPQLELSQPQIQSQPPVQPQIQSLPLVQPQITSLPPAHPQITSQTPVQPPMQMPTQMQMPQPPIAQQQPISHAQEQPQQSLAQAQPLSHPPLPLPPQSQPFPDQQPLQTQMPHHMANKKNESFGKLFVTNIPGQFTEEEFAQLLQPYAKNGQVLEIKFFKRVVADTCYAFVQFESSLDGQACAEDLNRRMVLGHTMRVGPASKKNAVVSETNLYVEGLPPNWGDEDLRNHFSQFGNVTAARVLYAKGSNESREVGFVHFKTHEDAYIALETSNGKKVTPDAPRLLSAKFANKTRKKDEMMGGPFGDGMKGMHMGRGRMGKKNHPMGIGASMGKELHGGGPHYSIKFGGQFGGGGGGHHNGGPPNRHAKFNEICRYFARGNCKRGNTCFYKHNSGEAGGNGGGGGYNNNYMDNGPSYYDQQPPHQHQQPPQQPYYGVPGHGYPGVPHQPSYPGAPQGMGAAGGAAGPGMPQQQPFVDYNAGNAAYYPATVTGAAAPAALAATVPYAPSYATAAYPTPQLTNYAYAHPPAGAAATSNQPSLTSTQWAAVPGAPSYYQPVTAATLANGQATANNSTSATPSTQPNAAAAMGAAAMGAAVMGYGAVRGAVPAATGVPNAADARWTPYGDMGSKMQPSEGQ